jgi:hypothetical protein
MHKARLAAASLALAAGLLATPVLAQAGTADWVSAGKVGRIDGYYKPAPYRDYGGTFHPSNVEGGSCVRVERKSGGGVWTTNYVYSATPGSYPASCDPDENTIWQITDDVKVGDTIGIRLYVYAGPNIGSYVVLCASKTACLGMRSP